MIAIKFSKKWCEENPQDRKASDILKKSEGHYHRSAIERIIYHNNLCNDISLSYVQNPVQLIEYLIEEFSFTSESSIKSMIILVTNPFLLIDLMYIYMCVCA